jgi:hypothetical protein
MMQNIPLALAKPEMVLARDVMRPESPGSVPICGKGTVLTASLIERLACMGIQSIIVEGHPVCLEGEGTLEEMLQGLDRRFNRVSDDPPMMKIKEMYRRQIIRSMEK